MIISPGFYFSDILRLLKTLYPTRVFNYFQILLGYKISILTGKVRLISSPFSLSFEVSSVCNLKCPQCASGRGEISRNKSYISSLFVESVLKQFSRKSFYVNFYHQGEPLMNKSLAQLIKTAKGLGYYTNISSNGMLLNKEVANSLVSSGLDRIAISVDGITNSSYAFYRKGGDLGKVKQGIINVLEARKALKKRNPLIIMQFLVNKVNESEIGHLKDFAGNLGVDVLQLKSMQLYDNRDLYLPENKAFNRYKKEGNTKRFCFRLWSRAVFTSDEQLVPCCYDKTPEHGFVQNQNDMKRLWKSKQFNDFRRAVLKQSSEIEICSNCGE